MNWSIETDKKIERDVAYTEGYNGGVLFGKAQGIELGIEQKERDVILNLFEKGYDLNDISDILKLSINKVQDIIDSSNIPVTKTR